MSILSILQQNASNSHVINDNGEKNNVHEDGTRPGIVRIASYLTGATTGLLLTARIFSMLLLRCPVLGTAGCAVVAALIGIASAVILVKGLLFVLNTCREWYKLKQSKNWNMEAPKDFLGVKSGALSNAIPNSPRNNQYQEPLKMAIETNPKNNLRTLDATAPLDVICVSFLLETGIGKTSESLNSLEEKLTSIIERRSENGLNANKEEKTKFFKSLNNMLGNSGILYQLIPSRDATTGRTKIRLIDLSNGEISKEEAELLVNYSYLRIEGWCAFFTEIETVETGVSEKILKARLDAYSDELPSTIIHSLRYDKKCRELLESTVKAHAPAGNNPVPLDLIALLAKICVQNVWPLEENAEISPPSGRNRLYETLQNVFKKAKPAEMTECIKAVNYRLQNSGGQYQVIPIPATDAADGEFKIRVIDLETAPISEDDAIMLVKYANLNYREWCDFLDDNEAINLVVREKIFEAYLMVHSDELLEDINYLLETDEEFKKALGKAVKAHTSTGNDAEKSNLTLIDLLAEAYTQYLLAPKHDCKFEENEEVISGRKTLQETVQETFKKADQKTKMEFVNFVDDTLQSLGIPYQLISGMADGEIRIRLK